MASAQDRRIEQMKTELPYGRWHLEDGTTVLFNRRYKPLDGDPERWVHWVKQEWFYNDGNPPWDNRQTLKRCRAALRGENDGKQCRA